MRMRGIQRGLAGLHELADMAVVAGILLDLSDELYPVFHYIRRATR